MNIKNRENIYLKKGFTIVEILVVMFVIVIMASITIALTNSLRFDFTLSGVAKDFLADLRYAQQLTVAEQEKYCLKLLFNDKKYQLKKCAGDVLFEKVLPNDIIGFSSTSFTDDEIEFNPYGAVKESGSITLENTNHKTKVIEIKPSGFVKIIN